MARLNQSLAGGVQRFYGVFRAKITNILSDGYVELIIQNIGDTEPKKAEIIHLMGGEDGQAGIRSYPSLNSNCFVIFEQGDKNTPKVIGYSESKTAGNSSQLQPGELLARTKEGSQLKLGNENLALTGGNGYGIKTDRTNFSLKHRKFQITSDDKNARMGFPGHTAVYTSGQAIHQFQDYFITNNDYKHNTTGKREDRVTGNFELKSQNNLSLKGSQVNLVGSEEINITSRNDMAILTDTYSLTAASDMYLATVLGDIEIAANAGGVQIASRAVSTADTGIITYGASVELLPTGTINIDNNTSNTEYTPAGNIEEFAFLGFEGTYGANGFSITSAANVEFESGLEFSVTAGTTVSVTAAVDISLTAAGSMTTNVGIDSTETIGGTKNINVGGAFNLTTAGTASITASVLNITSPLISFTQGVPILGAKVVTLLGPQFIIPG